MSFQKKKSKEMDAQRDTEKAWERECVHLMWVYAVVSGGREGTDCECKDAMPRGVGRRGDISDTKSAYTQVHTFSHHVHAKARRVEPH